MLSTKPTRNAASFSISIAKGAKPSPFSRPPAPKRLAIIRSTSLRPSATGHQENNAADETHAANNWSDRDAMFFFLVHFQRTEFCHVFSGGVTDRSKPAISERDDADQDENDAEDSRWLHVRNRCRP